MKRKVSQSAVETHDLSSRQYPAGPRSDLGTTNAIPFNEAEDVDLSGGRQCSWNLGRGDDCSNFSYTERGRKMELIPAPNPTRSKSNDPFDPFMFGVPAVVKVRK